MQRKTVSKRKVDPRHEKWQNGVELIYGSKAPAYLHEKQSETISESYVPKNALYKRLVSRTCVGLRVALQVDICRLDRRRCVREFLYWKIDLSI